MRVAILSQYYDPEPVPKAGEIARALRERGHEPFVITGFPNYPSGKLYDGFKLKLIRREVRDDVPIIRTFEFPYHGKNILGRILNYGSFVLSAPLGALFMKKPDVMYVWHPPLTVGIAALLISAIRRVPFVYDVQDIWPEGAVWSGLMRDGLLVRTMSVVERLIYRRAAHILVVTEGARQNLIGKGVPADHLTVMPHWVDERLFDDSAAERREDVRRQLGWQDRFVVMFAGNVGMVQGLDTAIRAATLIDPNSNALIVIVGDGSDRGRLVALAHEAGVENRVKFIEHQPMQRMPELMAAADALLVHLRRSELARYSIPTKTLAYLAAGRPIIMATEGAAAELICRARAGVAIAPENPELLARTIEDLRNLPEHVRAQFGAHGREYLHENLTKERAIAQYEELLSRVKR